MAIADIIGVLGGDLVSIHKLGFNPINYLTNTLDFLEPVDVISGLDPIMGDVINELIVECVRELGATTLSITHDMASARKIANRIAMIYGGKIIWAGPVGDIDESANPYVDQFISGRADGPIKMEALKP